MKMGATSLPTASQLAAQITAIFQQYFGRPPAAGGLQFWSNAVTAGQVDDANLPLAIVQSAQAADKAYFMKNYPQLAEQIFPVNTPNAGTAPNQGPIVTSTAPISTAAQQAQAAAVTAAAGNTYTTGTISMPVIVGASILALLLLERK